MKRHSDRAHQRRAERRASNADRRAHAHLVRASKLAQNLAELGLDFAPIQFGVAGPSPGDVAARRRARARARSAERRRAAAGKRDPRWPVDFAPIDCDITRDSDGLALVPERTWLPFTSAPRVSSQRRRWDQFVATMAIYAVLLSRMLAEAGLTDAQRTRLCRWLLAAQTCGDVVRIYRCPSHDHAVAVAECCHTPICPREQRRRAQRWQARADALADRFEHERREEQRRARDMTLSAAKRRAAQARAAELGRCRWRMITLGHTPRGTLAERVDQIVGTRAALARLLRRHYGMLAGFGRIECGTDRGGDGHLHVHMLVHSRYIPRDDIVRWLRARDCTVEGCAHPPDDRCDACRAARCSCDHAEPIREWRAPERDELRTDHSEPRETRRERRMRREVDGPAERGAWAQVGERARCNGSWYVDVRQAYVRRGGVRAYDPRGGVREAMKYLVAPVDPDDAPIPGTLGTRAQHAHAELVLRFHAAMAGRHAIETYGEAKPQADGEADASDDATPDHAHSLCCPHCCQRLVYACTGVRSGVRVDWFRESPRAVARAP